MTETSQVMILDRPADETPVRKAPPGHVVRQEDRREFTTEWFGPEDWLNAPPTYDAFAAQYLSYTRGRCVKFGVLASNLDDVVMEIITRFIERDFLPEFDPTYRTIGVEKGTSARASFRSWYSKFIFKYTLGKKRNSVKLALRELCVLDAPCGDDDTVTYGDFLTQDWSVDVAGEVEARDFLTQDFSNRLRESAERSGRVPVSVVNAVVLLSMTLSRRVCSTDVVRVTGGSILATRAAFAELARLAAELMEEEAVARKCASVSPV